MAFQLGLDAWSEAARRPTLQAMSQRLKRRVAATVGRGHSRRARLGDFSCADPEATSRSARIRWSPVRSPCRTRARSGRGHPWLSACLGKSAALRTVAAGQRVKRSSCDDGTGAGPTRRTSTVAGVHASTTGGNRTSRIDRIAEQWGTRTPYRPGEPWATRVATPPCGTAPWSMSRSSTTEPSSTATTSAAGCWEPARPNRGRFPNGAPRSTLARCREAQFACRRALTAALA